MLVSGDITQKGYEKKRNKLLAPFLEKLSPEPEPQAAKAAAGKDEGPGKVAEPAPTSEPVPGSSTNLDINNKPRSRRTHRRYYNEKRYHSEVGGDV